MTYFELLNETVNEFILNEIDDAEFQGKQLITTHFQMTNTEFVMKKNDTVSNVEIPFYRQKTQRILLGEPLQYVIGEWEFMGLDFFVGEGVLIPRPETELLVDLVLNKIENIKNPIIFDLCSGSGCIGMSIAKFRPDASVTLFEKSEKAIEYIKINIEENNVTNVKIVEWDIFNEYTLVDDVDAIVSNPPYIETAVIPSLQKQVQCEPRMALDGGIDGLDFYKAINTIWVNKLKPDGFFAVEHGDSQGRKVAEIFCENLSEIKIHYDLNNIDRIVSGKKR